MLFISMVGAGLVIADLRAEDKPETTSAHNSDNEKDAGKNDKKEDDDEDDEDEDEDEEDEDEDEDEDDDEDLFDLDSLFEFDDEEATASADDFAVMIAFADDDADDAEESDDAEDDDSESEEGEDESSEEDVSYPKLFLPFPQGFKAYVMQGYDGEFSHSGHMAHALDFDIPEGTPIASVADGRVIEVREDSNSGGPDRSFINDANFIRIDHGSGYYGNYLHMCHNCVDVEVGDFVKQGQVIGRSGNTGWSTKPHLHFAIYAFETVESVSYGFEDVAEEEGIPLQGKTYVSGNDGSQSISYDPSDAVIGETFSRNGIELDDTLPIVLSKAQTYSLSGRVTNGKTRVAVFLLRDGKWMDGATAKVDAEGNFSLEFSPAENTANGSYGVAMATSDENYFYSDFSSMVIVED